MHTNAIEGPASVLLSEELQSNQLIEPYKMVGGSKTSPL